jgi:hypothetical protein
MPGRIGMHLPCSGLWFVVGLKSYLKYKSAMSGVSALLRASAQEDSVLPFGT